MRKIDKREKSLRTSLYVQSALVAFNLSLGLSSFIRGRYSVLLINLVAAAICIVPVIHYIKQIKEDYSK